MLPTGMIDLDSKQVAIRKHIFSIAEKCFSMRGAVQIETPVAELLSTVTNLYGEEFDKLVYTLDQDAETKQKLILRYDLTVPLARYMGMNGLKQFKRFQIGKVYRRDNPQIQKGRYREFYQCDFDIAGSDDGSFTYDLEMLETIHDILDQILKSNNVTIRFNHRELVNNMLTFAGISNDNIKTVCSSLDKLDKNSLEEISCELHDKKISYDSIDNLCKLFTQLCDKTDDDKVKILCGHKILNDSCLANIKTIMSFIELMKFDNFVFDPFLIRGMDYYTGIIYEAQYNNSLIMQSTILAGGRYDNMMERFSNVGHVPAIGVSLGIERISKILETSFDDTCDKYDVYIASIGKELTPHKIKIASELRKHNIKSIMSHMNDQKMRHQLDTVFDKKIPIMIVIGTTEIDTDTVTIKNIASKTQLKVARELMIENVRSMLDGSNCIKSVC